MLLHQGLKIRSLHAGLGGGPGHVPGVPLQRLEDEEEFDLLHRFFTDLFPRLLQLFVGAGNVEAEARPHVHDVEKVALTYDFLAGEEDGAVHHVLQFADVAKHDWPGNVRELLNVLERLALFCQKTRVGRADVEQAIGGGARPGRIPELACPPSPEHPGAVERIARMAAG